MYCIWKVDRAITSFEMEWVFFFDTDGSEIRRTDGDIEEMANGENKDLLPYEQYGYSKVEPNRWMSCITVLHQETRTTTCLMELQ